MKFYGVRTQGVYLTCPESSDYKVKEFQDFYSAYRFAYSIKELNVFEVYVDASYSKDRNKASYAFLILKDGRIIYEESNVIRFNKFKSSSSAEIYAATKALKYCKSHKFKNVILYYDFIGIEKFATDEDYGRKNKSEVISKYREFVKSLNLNIRFYKIKSHSNDSYNNRVDKLARALTK